MTEIFWGVSFGHHDAALSVVQGEKILYASHSERYSRRKNDPDLHIHQIQEALSFGVPSKIFYYENPWEKARRYLASGEWRKVLQGPERKFRELTSKFDVLKNVPWKNTNHHRSHAAAGFYTSRFNDAIVVSCDAIGEIETLTVYHARNGLLDKLPLHNLKYPQSVGLFYSAVTKAVGLKPNEEEFILMGMSAFGQPAYMDKINSWISISEQGFPKWNSTEDFHFGLDLGDLTQQEKMNWAASAQLKVEEYILKVFRYLKETHPENENWVFMGGVALNCVLNTKIAESLSPSDRIHIFPSPGDSGSSLGAILGSLDRHVTFPNAFLGTPVECSATAEQIVNTLLEKGIVGIVNGRAEFGPRALGNRSLLADPRDPSMKEKLNVIKKREEFRPFAPVICQEDLAGSFTSPDNVKTSPFMQFVMKVKHPDQIPAVTHVDGSARVQTVTKETNPLLYEILNLWKQKTGCPVLVNTSLNIKGEPLVNSVDDAIKFEERYGIKVLY